MNYYSNPNVVLPATGTATGETDVADNAALITAERYVVNTVCNGILNYLPRFAMAACGTDELASACYDCAVNPAAEICREF